MKNEEFKAIIACKERAIHANPAMPIHERTAEYNRQLRENVSPELYVRYCCHQCGKHIDPDMIIVATQHVYHDVSEDAIYGWILHERLKMKN